MQEPQTPPHHSYQAAQRWYSGPRLWRALVRAALRTGRVTIFSSLTLFYCLRDKDTPTWAKGVIMGALGYLILPTDLIPDIIPGAGYSDDWGAIVAALGTVAAYIKDEHKNRAREQMDRIFGNKNPLPPVDFLE